MTSPHSPVLPVLVSFPRQSSVSRAESDGFWEAGSSLIPVTSFGPVGEKTVFTIQSWTQHCPGQTPLPFWNMWMDVCACVCVCVQPRVALPLGVGVYSWPAHTDVSQMSLHACMSACACGFPGLCVTCAHVGAVQPVTSSPTPPGWVPRPQNACPFQGSWQPLIQSSFLSPESMWPGVWYGGQVTWDGLSCFSHASTTTSSLNIGYVASVDRQ